jgi:AAT family amino acid transporter
MKGFPALTIFGLVLLALILGVGFWAEASRIQLFSTIVLIAAIAAACRLGSKIRLARQTS